jgi:hypothetical protein
LLRSWTGGKKKAPGRSGAGALVRFVPGAGRLGEASLPQSLMFMSSTRSTGSGSAPRRLHTLRGGFGLLAHGPDLLALGKLVLDLAQPRLGDRLDGPAVAAVPQVQQAAHLVQRQTECLRAPDECDFGRSSREQVPPMAGARDHPLLHGGLVRPDSVVDPRAGLTRINLPDAVSGETFATVSALCRFALFNMTLAASRHHKRSIALTMLPKLGTPDLQALVS